ncbi:hypothetical protein VT84_17140 [Gemmata sp. SH-PL17]|uniref:hypothetical protein n=1 Tax=Gemmata sp. SH-PL17 TaxID=1630693 RepID=UPI00078BA4B6|nr:hypothetical protein [Gemmata sp. SH-PL17]AMV26127.1 hypothetical protein VT84_17140 [Gemmata sp. SH-PL17]
MRFLALLALVAVIGCNNGVTTEKLATAPARAEGPVTEGQKGLAPAPHEPGVGGKLTLKQAREKLIAREAGVISKTPAYSGMKRDAVKKLFGAPDRTFEVSGTVNEVWVYTNRDIIWDAAAEKFYPTVELVFNTGETSTVLAVRAR